MNDLGIFYPQAEWYQARIGMVTSSKVKDAIAKRKRGDGDLACRKNLKMQMLAEILTGDTSQHYVSPAMDWGIEHESQARGEYELKTGLSVFPVGIVLHPTNPRAAATPDGRIKPNGLLEIKCPETYTHVEYLSNGVVPEEYRDQVDWQMACCGPEIEWADFVSFDPRIKDEDARLFIVRRERNNARIAEMEALVEDFLGELLQAAEALKRAAKGQTLTEKLTESIRAKGKFELDVVTRQQLYDEVVP